MAFKDSETAAAQLFRADSMGRVWSGPDVLEVACQEAPDLPSVPRGSPTAPGRG